MTSPRKALPPVLRGLEALSTLLFAVVQMGNEGQEKDQAVPSLITGLGQEPKALALAQPFWVI